MSPLFILKTETFTFGKKVMNICDTSKHFLEYYTTGQYFFHNMKENTRQF